MVEQRSKGYRLALSEFRLRSGTFGFIEVGIYCKYIFFFGNIIFISNSFCVPDTSQYGLVHFLSFLT